MKVNEILENLTQEEINQIKKKAIELPDSSFDDLDTLVIKLEKARRKGKLNYYAKFNGHKLYSLDVTMDKAYKEIFNNSKRVVEKRRAECSKKNQIRLEEMKKHCLENKDNWILEGKRYIHPEKHAAWEETVSHAQDGLYLGADIEMAIRIMEWLDDNSKLSTVKKIFDAIDSGNLYYAIADLVLRYAKRGPALYNYLYRRLDEPRRLYVSKIKHLNKMLDEGKTFEEAQKSLLDHQIYDIKLVIDNHKSEDFKEILSGTILVNEDNTFEGLMNDEYYVMGKIDGNKISLADFSNSRPPQHYCCYKDADIGRFDVYRFGGFADEGDAKITIRPSDINYIGEINFTNMIQDKKKHLLGTVLMMRAYYKQYQDEIDNETFNNIEYYLHERFVNSIKNAELKRELSNSQK